MPTIKAWVSILLVLYTGYSGPKETTSSKRYPAFFLYVPKKDEMLHLFKKNFGQYKK